MNPKIICGGALDVITGMQSASVDCVVTSPPYWNLRDYGEAGQLGAENSPEEYIENLRAIFFQAKRVLKKEGSLWLNLGDSYWGSGRGFGADYTQNNWKQSSNRGAVANTIRPKTTKKHPVFKAKDLMLLPSRVAIALQADGWYLRSKVIWQKPNAMPESVEDRPTNDYEEVFFFTKSKSYFYDIDALREPHNSLEELKSRKTLDNKGTNGGVHEHLSRNRDEYYHPEGRNKRAVWSISTANYRGAHFATMPLELAETCIKASCPVGGIVLDPFGGSGTTAESAIGLNRDYRLIELNPDYVLLAEERVRNVQRPLFL